jgi:L-alanine-DL-glutamate epimerase-like enolase superfamily enzyme
MSATGAGQKSARVRASSIPIEKVEVCAYKVPTDYPESDGTLEWDKTTIVIVEIEAAGMRGLGYTYADTSTAKLIRDLLGGAVEGCDALDVPAIWRKLMRAIRNLGRPGICSMAISAVDIALWDLKARLLDLPLVKLLGAARDGTPVYGSGGFTSYSLDQLQRQLSGWVSSGISMVKMKVGRNPEYDLHRVRAAREAIGPGTGLFVDANGAYDRKRALRFAWQFREQGVSWFEEPVSADDLEGLRLLRDRGPEGMDIAAGEYGYDLIYLRRMLEAGAVDVLQADATRCGGITGFLHVSALCTAHSMPLSAHTAPNVHAHVCCALPDVMHIEYFHDHVRIEEMFFEGGLPPLRGKLQPDLTRPGLGLELRRSEVRQYAVA